MSNITFLIGNGFDMRMGIESSYKSALKNYINIPNDDPDIQNFKSSIEKDLEHWSDFELALGIHTDTFLQEEQETFRKCVNDFTVELTKYLMAEEEKIDFDLCAERIKTVFLDSIQNFTQDLAVGHKNEINSVFTNQPESIIFRFISFNYTRILDECISYSFISNQAIANHGIGNRSFGHFVNREITHVHGKFPSQIIMGVDSPTQIGNENWAKQTRFCSGIVKPQINKRAGTLADSKTKEIIDHSSIICIFGMSLGETDKTWWKYIGEWLLRDNHRLIIFSRSSSLTDLSSYLERFAVEDKIRDRFFDLAEITEPVRNALEGKVYIIVNSKLFNINLVEETQKKQKTFDEAFDELFSNI